MFTFVTVAFVLTIIGLTAFVPRVRGWVQWLFRKAALALNLLGIGLGIAIAFAALLVVFVPVVAAWLVGTLLYELGNLLGQFGTWLFETSATLFENVLKRAGEKARKAVKRF